MDDTTTAAAALPSTTANSRIGAPTYQSRASSTMPRLTVLPRSGWSMISANSTMDTGTSGTSRCRYWLSSARLVTSTCAPHRASATLASSTGWNDSEPRVNQECSRPLAPLPSGVSTNASRPAEISSRVGLNWRSQRSGTRSPR
jgi:hypothetical protein